MDEHEVESGGLRRVPTQERSRRRVERIVEAAAGRFAVDGFAAATVEQIAADAGVPIGSVYQFFRDKRALFKAVAIECLRRSREQYTQLLGDEPLARPWPELLERLLDGYAALADGDPYFRALWRNYELYAEYEKEDRVLLQEMTGATELILGHWAPHLDPDQRRITALMLVETAGLIVFLAMRMHPDDGPAILGETKRMLRAYLEAVLGAPAERPQP